MNNPYSRFPATGEIARYIKSFHVADHLDGTMEIEAPPTGYPVLGHIFRGFAGAVVEGRHYAAGPMPFNILAGQIYRQRAVVRWSGGIGHVAAEMTATGLWELFHVDGSSVINMAAPVSDLAPRIDAALHEAVARHGPSPEAFQSALAPFVAAARQAPEIITEAVRRIEETNGVILISEVFSEADLSMPVLNKQFRQIVGLPPKYFARVAQFNHVAGLVLSGDSGSLAELAIEAGYYDQAHFTRAVKEFVLKSPGAFLESDVSRVSTFVRLEA